MLKIDDYIAKAKNFGLTHIAITDHGSMAAMFEFHEKCKKASITGIIGMEAYIVADRLDKTSEHLHDDWHLLLLAKNKEGVKNLIRIHNDAQINGFYGKPKTDISVLRKYGKGIIATSACIGGEIPQAILNQDKEFLIKRIREYKEVFDEFYFEIQPGRFREQIVVNDCLALLSEKTGIPLVATNDIHYLNSEDYIVHDQHIKGIRRNQDADSGLIYPDTCYYLMSEDELRKRFMKTKHLTDEAIEAAIQNTNIIAEKCDGEVDYNFEMPRYLDLPENETEDSYLARLCFSKLKKREQEIPDPTLYSERLSYELGVIKDLGFSGYFLVTMDFLEYARSHGIALGPGRGSVGGSLVAYLLNITKADPIKYHLVFERFLNPFRKSPPDIDVDSSDPGAIKDYLIEHYGKNHCALVGTFGTRAAKDALRSAARLICETPSEAVEIGDEICKTAPFKVTDEAGERISSPSIEQMLEASPRMREKQKKYPKVFESALNMESFPKSLGIHAAGIVVSPHDIVDGYIPVRVDKESGRLVSMIDMKYIENAAIKFDELSLGTAAIIDHTERDACIKLNLDDEHFFEDAAVWDAISSSNTIGIFQISSALYRQRMPRLHPNNLDELAACLALIRGPCVSSGLDEVYMQIVEGTREPEKIDPIYDSVTAYTKGICIYQEEIIKLGTSYGMSMEQADMLRKATSKKKIEVIKELKEVFYEDARKLGTPEDHIDRIFEIIQDSAKYSFNQSHATLYAMVVYMTAWLKVHYPCEFMANILTNAYTANKDDKKIFEMVNECKRLGIQFLPVDANKSVWGFRKEGKKIRIGFCAIKAFGEKAAESFLQIRPIAFKQIIENINNEKEIKKYNMRKAGKLNPKEMPEHLMPNKKTIEALVIAGAFGSKTNANRKELLKMLAIAKGVKTEVPDKIMICKGCIIDLVSDSEADIEKKMLRANFIHDKTSDLNASGFQGIPIGTSFDAEVLIESTREVIDRRRQKMAFLSLRAKDASFEGIVFGTVYPDIKDKIHKGKSVVISAKKDKENCCIVYDVDERS